MFLYYGFADHRDLHSFPTRRSSDLMGKVNTRSRYSIPLHCPGKVSPGNCATALGMTAVAPARQLNMRSEEHTSELQSRRDLVCRLLLEKKKKLLYIDIYFVV